MIKYFISKEFFENIYGPKFLITFAICAVLILTSMYTGYELYTSEQAWYATAKNENLKAAAYSGSYGALRVNGTKTLRAPSRLSIFVQGSTSSIGKAATVSEDSNIVLRDSRYGLNPIFAVFGELDLAFIVKIILSLFAILFSYNSISGERELGTLKLVMSTSVSRASFIIGKAIGGILGLLIPFLLPLLTGLLMLSLVFGVSFNPEEWIRIVAMTLVFFLYLAVFYIIGMFMSALTRHSFVSFLLALFIWVLSIVIIPKGAVELAGQISPAPSIDRMETEMASLSRDYYTNLKNLTLENMRENYDGNRDNIVPAFRSAWQYAQDAAKELREKNQEPILQRYALEQARLLNTAESISRISPTSCVTLATSRLTNTSAELQDRFLTSLRLFRNEFLKYVDLMLEKHPDLADPGININLRSDTPKITVPDSEIELSGFPDFQLNPESLNVTVGDVLVDIGILSAYFIILFAGTFLAFLRYDVR